MSDMYITYFQRLSKDENGDVVMTGDYGGKHLVEKISTLGATAKQSGAFPGWANFAEIIADAATHYVIATGTPTADQGDMLLPANTSKFVGVRSSQKISVRTTA